MRLFRGLYNFQNKHRVLSDEANAKLNSGLVATIGNFDGVHLGHQAILQKLTAKAAELELASLVVLFEPHPQEFFRPDAAPARLYKLTDKLRDLQSHGLDFVLCLPFTQQFSQMPAEQFIEEILQRSLNVKHLFIGDDFKFGFRRQGDFELLKSVGAGLFTVEANQSVTYIDKQQKAVRVSSSRVRDAISDSDFALATSLLGKNYRLSGKVVHGDKQGRLLGVPTANIALKRLKSPIKGVYAVRVYGISANPLWGVANIGHKPTLNKSRERLEVHLLDFAADIYGKKIEVEPVAKIRAEQKFASIDLLKQQIAQDIVRARQLLASESTIKE